MMKPVKYCLLGIICLCLSQLFAQTPATRWFTDADAKADTFWISNAEELAGLAQIVNDGNDFRGKTIVLVNDIDLTNWDGWLQVGRIISGLEIRENLYSNVYAGPDSAIETVKRPFSGIFDGNGKTVKGLKISKNNNSYNTSFIGLFGFVENGVVKNVGVVDLYIYDEHYIGGVVGSLDGGTVTNCYSFGTIYGGDNIGGIVGAVNGGSVTNCYSSVRVSGEWYVGGVVGALRDGGRVLNCYSTGDIGRDPDLSDPAIHPDFYPQEVGGVVGLVYVGTISNCYSTGTIRGNYYIGGVVGHLMNGEATSCVALNPVVNAPRWSGRVIGSGGDAWQGGEGDYKHTDNFAFRNIRNMNGTFPDIKGASTVNGEDITIEEILSDSTLDNLFTKENGWTTEKGKLPGLLGKPVDIPDHLFKSDAIASHEREIPVAGVGVSDNAVALVAPLNKLTSEFSVGPNPASKSSGTVNFYFQGKRIKSGALIVCDASGNFVKKIGIRNETSGNLNNRLIAAWNIKDNRGRPVSKGTYLIRGTVTTVSGETEKVSAVMGVR